jgi:hypothetical protein
MKLFSVIVVLSVLVSGCSLVNLRHIGLRIYPAGDRAVLPEGDTPLRVSFDTEMDRLETQRALSVSHPGGAVKGDLLWNGGELRFVPLEPWERGVRYTLSLSGTVFSRDGRELRVSHFVPFYAFSAEGGPYVISYSPGDGTSIGTGTGEKLRIRFSMPMDRQSTADALTVDGLSERVLEWFEDDTLLELGPKNPLLPWTVYRWTLGVKAKSRDGAPLVRASTGIFVTDADRTRPCVLELSPLMEGSGLEWIRTGLSLEDGLGPGQAIGVVFNKPMDESVLSCLRFNPSLPGRIEAWTESSIVFIPDNDPEPEKIYTLIVSGETKDRSGLKMEGEYRTVFIPDFPYLKLLYHEEGNLIKPEGILKITLRFSLPFSAGAKAETVPLLWLDPYFPGTLPAVSLRSAHWWSDDILELEFEGIESGVSEAHYYKLQIPGGRGGISNGGGSYFKENLVFYIEGGDDA